MKKQSGFTLIELVIVIVILGILAATAVPKFVNLQGEARAAAMKGVKGALEGAASITYAKAAIDGQEALSAATSTDLSIDLVFGYPKATSAALSTMTELSAGDWVFSDPDGATPATVTITASAASGATGTGDTACNVTYKEAEDKSTRPVIAVNDKGC